MNNQPNTSYYAQRPGPYRSQSTNGLAIASLVLGILAVLSGWFFMGIIFGSAAVVIGIVGLKKAGGGGVAQAGIITGGIGALTGAIFTTIWIVALMQAGTIPSPLTKLSKGLIEQNKVVKTQIAAKKDFSKGDTGIFGTFEVKIKSVRRDYAPDNTALRAGEGKELIVVDLSVKNTGSSVKSFTSFGLQISKDSIVSGLPAIAVAPAFNGKEVGKGTTSEGNVVFEVPKGATGLKLLYQEIVYDLEKGVAQTLTYSLGM